MRITEITKIPAGEFNISKSDLPGFNKGMAKKSKPLPGGSGLVYNITNDMSGMDIVISDPNTQEAAGQLSLSISRYFPIPKAHYVEAIAVDPDRRGQGIAKSLYGIYLSIIKYPLLAGAEQTPGGRRNWLSLANIPGVEVRGYVSINDEYFDEPGPARKKFDQLIDNIMNMGGEYMGKTEKYHYFSFDVVPGTGELAPAVKNELKLYGYHDLANPGLYAIWTGQ